VRRAQLLLGISGFRLAEDGVFGPATEAAVAGLQRGQGLPVTGKLDPATWALLVSGVKP
jgi:peptidoglycan hydrolase-like protein with peptidoglycan-binding domain